MKGILLLKYGMDFRFSGNNGNFDGDASDMRYRYVNKLILDQLKKERTDWRLILCTTVSQSTIAFACYIFELTHVILAVFVLRKIILQIRIWSDPLFTSIVNVCE